METTKLSSVAVFWTFFTLSAFVLNLVMNESSSRSYRGYGSEVTTEFCYRSLRRNLTLINDLVVNEYADGSRITVPDELRDFAHDQDEYALLSSPDALFDTEDGGGLAHYYYNSEAIKQGGALIVYPYYSKYAKRLQWDVLQYERGVEQPGNLQELHETINEYGVAR